ncbi:hypothetical protein MTR67_000278 [Solanum verrucosum]|uniref:Uncharacterized protein n=1 Tax=Solanum verrucosum TaxID=315347 RepID=A0AAF0T7A3_SOLVR|nr:hypothetical protein MTR67_000278 [Solanum verrucosum]
MSARMRVPLGTNNGS